MQPSTTPTSFIPRILIIDDDPNVRRLFIQFLSRESYILDQAEDGEKGMVKIAQEEYDLVITDLQMQNGDGLQILNAARQKDDHLQVLIVTGFGSVTTAVHAMKMGAFDYLTKPLQSDTLLIKVRNALERRRLQHLLQEQQQKLNEQHQLIQQDLDLARQVQTSLVPAAYQTEHIDVAVRYRPMLGIGGDFADVYDDGKGVIYLSVVDVTGHGIAAALMVNRVYSELRLYVRAGQSPRQILHSLNEFFMQTFTEISLFLTMVSIRCDVLQKKISWAGSAHPAGLLIQPTPHPIISLASQNRIIGFADSAGNDFIEQQIDLTVGDRLILYTDGMIETENKEGKPLAFQGLLKLAKISRRLPPAAAAAAMIQQTLDYGNNEPGDDLLLLVADLL